MGVAAGKLLSVHFIALGDGFADASEVGGSHPKKHMAPNFSICEFHDFSISTATGLNHVFYTPTIDSLQILLQYQKTSYRRDPRALSQRFLAI